MRKGCCFVICTTQWMQKHTSHLENKIKRGFSVGIRWLGGRGLHTTRTIAQILVFVADLIACKL